MTFDNDYWNPGVADRNLIVNSVTVGDKTVFAADSHVVSTSGPSADGISDVTADGGRELFTSSSLTFDTAHAGQNDGLGTPLAHDPAPISDPGPPQPQPEPTPAFDPAPVRHGQPLAGWIDVTSYHHSGDPDDTAMFQRALADLHEGQTLYIPKGTYNISHTLEMQGKINVSVYGEDPAHTILNWTGKGGTILDVDGVSDSNFSGFSINGNNHADTLIENRWGSDLKGIGTGGQYVTGDTWTDIGLSNATTGISIGADGSGPYGGSVSEQVFERVNFTGLGTAVDVENANALDIAVRNSHFADNGIGVHIGSGEVHVYDSTFERSSVSDVQDQWQDSSSLIGNTSIGSARFFETTFRGDSSSVVLQGNHVYDPTDGAAISLSTPANLTLIDNVFRSAPGYNGPVIDASYDLDAKGRSSHANITSEGNTYGGSSAFGQSARVASANDAIVDRGSVSTDHPQDFAFAKTAYGQPVFELGPDATSADVQHAIDAASAYTGLKPIIHFASGEYNFGSTITLPPGSDIILQGEGGGATNFHWRGEAGGTMFHIQGPSNVEMDNFGVQDGSNGSASGDGKNLILIDGIDNDASHVTINQTTSYLTTPSITVDHVDHAHVALNSAVFLGDLNIDGGDSQVIVRDGQLGNVHQTSGSNLLVADYYSEQHSAQKFDLHGDAKLTIVGGRQQNAAETDGAFASNKDVPFIHFDADYTGETNLVGYDAWQGRIASDSSTKGHLNLIEVNEITSVGGADGVRVNTQSGNQVRADWGVYNSESDLANTPGVNAASAVSNIVGALPDLSKNYYAPQPGGSNVVFNGVNLGNAGGDTAGIHIQGGDVGGAAAAYEAAHPAASAASQMASYPAQSQSGQQANAMQTHTQSSGLYTNDGSIDPNALIASLTGTKMGMGDLTAAANTRIIMPAADQAAAAALPHAMDAYAATDTSSAHHYHGDDAGGHNTHHHVYDDMMV